MPRNTSLPEVRIENKESLEIKKAFPFLYYVANPQRTRKMRNEDYISFLEKFEHVDKLAEKSSKIDENIFNNERLAKKINGNQERSEISIKLGESETIELRNSRQNLSTSVNIKGFLTTGLEEKVRKTREKRITITRNMFGINPPELPEIESPQNKNIIRGVDRFRNQMFSLRSKSYNKSCYFLEKKLELSEPTLQKGSSIVGEKTSIIGFLSNEGTVKLGKEKSNLKKLKEIEEKSGELSHPIDPLYDKIVDIEIIDNEEFKILTYDVLQDILNINEDKRILRRKSTEKYIFGEFKAKKKLMGGVTLQRELLVQNYLHEEKIKNKNKALIKKIKLPWYLQKEGLSRRFNALRTLVSNIALKKQLNFEKLQSQKSFTNLPKDLSDPQEKKFHLVLQAKGKMLSGVTSNSLVDIRKFKEILELSLTEKPVSVYDFQSYRSQATTADQRFSIPQSPGARHFLTKFRKAVYVLIRICIDDTIKLTNQKETKSTIKNLFMDGSRKRALKRLKKKKMVTRINNKLNLAKGLFYNVINLIPSRPFSQIKLTIETKDKLKELLNRNENQENIRNMIEEKKFEMENLKKSVAKKKQKMAFFHRNFKHLEKKPKYKGNLGSFIDLIETSDFMKKKKLENMKNIKKKEKFKVRGSLNLAKHLNLGKSSVDLSSVRRLGTALKSKEGRKMGLKNKKNSNCFKISSSNGPLNGDIKFKKRDFSLRSSGCDFYNSQKKGENENNGEKFRDFESNYNENGYNGFSKTGNNYFKMRKKGKRRTQSYSNLAFVVKKRDRRRLLKTGEKLKRECVTPYDTVIS